MIRGIVRDYNEEQFDKTGNLKNKEEIVIVSMFSCHILRHTFAIRIIEADVNPKVVQELLGHADVATTLNIYVDSK